MSHALNLRHIVPSSLSANDALDWLYLSIMRSLVPPNRGDPTPRSETGVSFLMFIVNWPLGVQNGAPHFHQLGRLGVVAAFTVPQTRLMLRLRDILRRCEKCRYPPSIRHKRLDHWLGEAALEELEELEEHRHQSKELSFPG